jgi:hypothetical protein
MTSRAGLASPARVTSPASRRDRAHRLGAWGKALRARGVHDSPSGRMRPRKEPSPQLIDRPSRESRGASVLETARACSDGGFSGNHRCSCDEQSSLVSPVLGRDGSGRHGFGCWVARVSAGALQPESDSECPLSLQHAVAGALRKERLRAQRASFFEVSPRLRGKDELRQGQRPATGARLRSNVLSRSVRVSRWWLAIGDFRERKLATAPVSAPPGKGCRGPAECVTVWFVHAF